MVGNGWLNYVVIFFNELILVRHPTETIKIKTWLALEYQA